MMDGMADLVQFLRARLDEDNEAAEKAAALCGCHPATPSWEFRDGDDEEDGRIIIVGDPHPVLLGKRRRLARRWNRSCDGLFTAEHIVRHDPARILAEVAAKRRILDEYEASRKATSEASEDAFEYVDAWAEGQLRLVQFLALPHSGHPDYQDMWRPRVED